MSLADTKLAPVSKRKEDENNAFIVADIEYSLHLFNERLTALTQAMHDFKKDGRSYSTPRVEKAYGKLLTDLSKVKRLGYTSSHAKPEHYIPS